jgi:hypothetical protein
MTTELIAVETNCETGETITRPFTPEEVAEYEANVAAAIAEKAANDAAAATLAALKASAKSKLVAGEPLTEEEAATIVL